MELINATVSYIAACFALADITFTVKNENDACFDNYIAAFIENIMPDIYQDQPPIVLQSSSIGLTVG